MDTLKLTYPSIQEGQHLLVETRPAHFKKWLEQLPSGNMSRVLHEVTETVFHLNRSELKPAQRELMNQELDAAYEFISHFYRTQSDRAGLSVELADRECLQNLTCEMAFSYKRLLDDIADKKFLIRKNQRFKVVVNQAIHYLGLLLMAHYENYAPIPIYLWRELHSLYRFAEHLGITRDKTPSTSNSLDSLLTIELTYLRVCLMAVLNPYHLDKGEHWQLYHYLAHSSHLCEISDNLDLYQQHNCFVIDLNGSDKPHFAVNELENPEDPKLRLLLVDQLKQSLTYQIGQAEEFNKLPATGFFDSLPVSKGLDLLRRLLAYCDYRVERDSERTPVLTKVDLVIGVSSIYQLLQAGPPKNDDAESHADALAKQLGALYSPRIRWQAVNYSHGGLCITNSKQDVSELRVGDIIFYKLHENGALSEHWQLGISRWINGSQRDGATVGIKNLPGELQPARISGLNPQGKRLIQQPVLQVAHRTGGQVSYSFIAPKGLFRSGAALDLVVSGQKFEIQTAGRLESSARVEIFEFEVTNDRKLGGNVGQAAGSGAVFPAT